MEKVLERLQQANFRANLCESKNDYLGYITRDGIQPQPKKVEVIRQNNN
jgi:hypothetical protein